ncbi:hypothetical protein Tco_1022975, partial [Tanacetum coccineum]
TMADMNVRTNDAPAEQAPAIAPPTRTDDQIFPLSKWVPIGKSNCVLDAQKSQRNPIFSIVVAILKNTNFFRAFTTSSTILAIYIQQFWDTMCFDSSTGLYIFQLDEQWFNLHKDILRDALDITPTNDNNPFVASPSSDIVIEYGNTLGYPCTLRNMSAMSVNALYQPRRAILSMINMCLTGKTARYDRLRHPVLQIMKNLTTASHGKKKSSHLLILSVREIFGMPIHDALLTDVIKGAPYYSGYLEHVATKLKATKQTKPSAPMASKVTKPADDKTPKPTSSQPPKPKPAPTKPSKSVPEKKRKLVKETPDEPSPAKRSKGGLVGKRRKSKSPLKLVDEPIFEGILGNGKEKVSDEQAAHDLLILQSLKKKSPADQFIFQRRTPMTTEPSGHAESPSLDAEQTLTDSETESDEEVHVINAGVQDEGHAGQNPGEQDEGHTGPNPGKLDEARLDQTLVMLQSPNLNQFMWFMLDQTLNTWT